jgi:hypothetical protein
LPTGKKSAQILFVTLVFCFGGSRGQKAAKKMVAAGKFWAKQNDS